MGNETDKPRPMVEDPCVALQHGQPLYRRRLRYFTDREWHASPECCGVGHSSVVGSCNYKDKFAHIHRRSLDTVTVLNRIYNRIYCKFTATESLVSWWLYHCWHCWLKEGRGADYRVVV